MTTFDDLPLFRNTDPEGSVNGAKHITPKRGSQAMQTQQVAHFTQHRAQPTTHQVQQSHHLFAATFLELI